MKEKRPTSTQDIKHAGGKQGTQTELSVKEQIIDDMQFNTKLPGFVKDFLVTVTVVLGSKKNES